MKYINSEHTIIQDGLRSIPTDPNNTDYAKILESEVEIEDYVAPTKTWVEIRGERDALLNASDWMAMADRTLTDAQATYRQALRDIPADYADPASVVWPTL
jgi:hypothetical protein